MKFNVRFYRHPSFKGRPSGTCTWGGGRGGAKRHHIFFLNFLKNPIKFGPWGREPLAPVTHPPHRHPRLPPSLQSPPSPPRLPPSPSSLPWAPDLPASLLLSQTPPAATVDDGSHRIYDINRSRGETWHTGEFPVSRENTPLERQKSLLFLKIRSAL